jgi:hypothetical protein
MEGSAENGSALRIRHASGEFKRLRSKGTGDVKQQ